jgi:hypothetical protein
MEIPDQLFVVRTWFERSDPSSGAWRGSITHVATGTRWYFAELGELSDFIRARLESVSLAELDVNR